MSGCKKLQDVEEQMRRDGFEILHLELSDRFQRFGKKQRQWARVFEYAVVAGDHSTQMKKTYPLNGMNSPSVRHTQSVARHSNRDREMAHASVANEVRRMFAGLNPCGTSEYLGRKHLGDSHGSKYSGGTLVIPIADANGLIWSLQYIYPDGQKRFHFGGRIEGGLHLLGSGPDDRTVLLAEGFASAASVREATNLTTFMAFNAGNLPKAAAVLRRKFPAAQIVICGDDDRWNTGTRANVGREKADAAARKADGLATFPVFSLNDLNPTDFNDLHCLQGIKTVTAQLTSVINNSIRRSNEK